VRAETINPLSRLRVIPSANGTPLAVSYY
jgi:hypothetical protein